MRYKTLQMIYPFKERIQSVTNLLHFEISISAELNSLWKFPSSQNGYLKGITNFVKPTWMKDISNMLYR